MGEVVAFRMRARKPREDSAPPSGDAQILFFLGVRYARIEDPADAQGVAPDEGRGPHGGKKRKSRARA
jgi:hypothetical protein